MHVVTRGHYVQQTHTSGSKRCEKLPLNYVIWGAISGSHLPLYRDRHSPLPVHLIFQNKSGITNKEKYTQLKVALKNKKQIAVFISD